MCQLADSFDGFLDAQWPAHYHFPTPDLYWSLSERWAWSQGKPGSPEETKALEWAKANFFRRYKKLPEVTGARKDATEPKPKPSDPRLLKKKLPDTVKGFLHDTGISEGPKRKGRKPALVF